MSIKPYIELPTDDNLLSKTDDTNLDNYFNPDSTEEGGVGDGETGNTTTTTYNELTNTLGQSGNFTILTGVYSNGTDYRVGFDTDFKLSFKPAYEAAAQYILDNPDQHNNTTEPHKWYQGGAFRWELNSNGNRIGSRKHSSFPNGPPSDDFWEINVSPLFEQLGQSDTIQHISIKGQLLYKDRDQLSVDTEQEIEIKAIPNFGANLNDMTPLAIEEASAGQLIPLYAPYIATITDVSQLGIEVNYSFNQITSQVGIDAQNEPETVLFNPETAHANWTIKAKTNDRRDLNTFLYFGEDKKSLVVNAKTDNKTIKNLPYSVIYKTYEPLPDDITEKDQVYVAKQILPSLTETVELVGYAQEDEDFQVLIPKDTFPKESPITKRQTEFKTYEDLVTTDSQLQDEIENKFLKETSAELSIDYSQYENFINFSSAQKRLENFKYKIEQIEKQTALSASFVGVTNGGGDVKIHHNNIRDIKNNFDGYEKYLYSTDSNYVTSSMGEFHDSSWPKTGAGTYNSPFKPVSSSNSDFTTWYGSLTSKTGQLYSASFYDTDNGNRLVNLLPDHIRSDSQNQQFLDFMDMIGQQFDELWTYIKSMTDISDRRMALEDGFSKDLIFNLAKSLGWDMQDGKDLLDLSRYGFGQKLSGDSYSLYTSGSLSSPVEADVSKEITKRLISSMPFILKSKGTEASIKAILNCYGIPSTILKVREFGGLDTSTQRAPFETKRRFTKALGLRGAQYVSSSWANDATTSRKPETVEMRFRSVSGSDQVLVQKEEGWAIKLKDNGVNNNMGTVAFVLSGSDGFKTVSSSLLPVFDGDYYSMMLKKETLSDTRQSYSNEPNLFPFPYFETGSIFSPPFVPNSSYGSAHNGEIQIVSSSNVAKQGTNSLEHRNTFSQHPNKATVPPISQRSYTIAFKSGSWAGEPIPAAAVADVSAGQTYTFSAYAKVSGSDVSSVGQLEMYELDSNERIINNSEDTNPNSNAFYNIGGKKSSYIIPLNETEWKEITVTKHIRFSHATKLGISFVNYKAGKTIFWDDVSIRQVVAPTDVISHTHLYKLYVKKYSSGLDRVIQQSNASLVITGSVSQSYNASWTGSGDLYIGGKPSDTFGSQLTGSVMEFRLWNEPLKEQYFDNHVSDPKSYIGNNPSSSYDSLITRYSFDDNTSLSNGSTIRDVSSNQTTTTPGYAFGFGGVNTFENVIDSVKTLIPNYGPNRNSSDKIRIEDNFLSGSGVTLSVGAKYDFSTHDYAPVDSNKVGVYFSPTDVVNDDIISSVANLDFNQILGDPRDNFKSQYSDLQEESNKYFKKYSDNNNFWDYLHLIKFYDQSVFKNIKKLIPMRAKPQLGTVIEPNIFERSKNPIQRNHPSFQNVLYETNLNVTDFNFNESTNEASHSVLTIRTEYPNYEGEIDKTVFDFQLPSLYEFKVNHNYDDSTTYVSASLKDMPSYVYTEATAAMATNQRLSERNQEYKFFYNSESDFLGSSRYSIDSFENLYNSRSLHESDKDTSYQDTTALNRLFYEGVKNTSDTTIDGDLPFIVTTTAPTVAVPTTKGISKLNVNQVGDKKKMIPKKPKRRPRRPRRS
jgi:hypothetical protein